jgi:hypothetical protein
MSLLTTPPSWTVGCFASLLHSMMLPIDPGVRPLAVKVTDAPLVNPVAGVIVGVTVFPAAADALDATPRIVIPVTPRRTAPSPRSLDAMWPCRPTRVDSPPLTDAR